MSDSQTVWSILWDHASKSATVGSPFEIDEVLPEVCRALGVSEAAARKLISGLLVELDPMPAGRQFFGREGNAVVPLQGFFQALKEGVKPLDAYPYEL
jgi:hypothetical protein